MFAQPYLRGVLVSVLTGGLILFAYLCIRAYGAEEVKAVILEHRILGAVLFGTIMFSTTVIAPLTSLPMVPVVAPFLGPFTTGLVSFIGWALGAFLAFWIGRRYGRPVIGKFVSLESLNRYEAYLKPETGFMLIVVLRMVVPVDILSYALGIFSTVSFPIYALATMLGIVWFSFAFAYLGDALFSGNYVLLSLIGVASVLVLVGSWRYVRKGLRKEGMD